MSFRRTGLRTMRNLAYSLCQIVATWTPTIKKVYPSATALHAAIDAANAACAALVAEADEVLPIGD